MIAYIEPLKLLIYDEKAISGVSSSGFGGFCECGGVMSQKTWHQNGNLKILISECENCWKIEAIIFRETDVIAREEVKSFKRNDLKEFLSTILSNTELEAVMDKLKGTKYNYNAYNRAKKKLEEIGLSLDDLISEIIF